MSGPRTLYDKVWNDHVIDTFPDGTCLLLVDRQLLYAGVSHKAFETLRMRGLPVRRPKCSVAVEDHLVPTREEERRALPPATRESVERLIQNCGRTSISYIPLDDIRQGIVHVTGPEQGLTLPGTVTVCADSHTSTHGALGALAMGIGTSEQEHVLATQTLTQRKSRNLRIHVEGRLGAAITAKDVALAIIGRFGASVGVGSALEFSGPVIRNLSMEGRMTLCNMGVEAGARASLIAPDDTTFDWLRGRQRAPRGVLWDQAVAYWRTLKSDTGALFDSELSLDVSSLTPQVTWGTSPDEVAGINDRVPDPVDAATPAQAANWARALAYMGLQPGMPIRDIPIQRVFIGSCTNARIEDLRAAAAVVKGRHVVPSVNAMVVPGSGLVKAQAEEEGLDAVFLDAGFEWRLPGCSMCFGNAFDSVATGEHCASTSNRNFENRQGGGARTHLLSPAMAAAAAVAGRLTDVRELD